MFGVSVVDAMLSYNYEQNASLSVAEFASNLALLLIFNQLDGHVVEGRRRSSVPVQCNAHPLRRQLSQLKIYEGMIGSKEGVCQKCSVCAARGERHNAHYYCVSCSDESSNSIVAVCGHPSMDLHVPATQFTVRMPSNHFNCKLDTACMTVKQ